MPRKYIPNLVVENAELRFKNFAGLAGKFNREGDRNFCLLLNRPDIDVDQMVEDGWNVKMLKPREGYEDEGMTPYIQVAVSYKYENKAPKIVFVTSNGKNQIPQDLVAAVDFLEMVKCDVTINPSPWEVDGNRGIKAYLKTMYITIREDPLDLKYADVPESSYMALESSGEPLQITDGNDDIYVEFEER